MEAIFDIGQCKRFVDIFFYILERFPRQRSKWDAFIQNIFILYHFYENICHDANHLKGQNLVFIGKYHGVILLPEGLVESIPEVYALLQVLTAS